jgi:6-phosphogluconolactonase
MALVSGLLPSAVAAEMLLYVGTETAGASRGIYVSTFDETTGALSSPRLAAAIGNPSFLAVHPRRAVLYSVAAQWAADGSSKEEVAAFAVQPDGTLRPINSRPSGGSGPCHIAVDAGGRVLLLANYNGGNIVSYPILDDGSLGPAVSTVRHEGSSVNRSRQSDPHPHGIYPGPDQTRVYVPDLGIDKVMIHRLDPASGRLGPNRPGSAPAEPGGGPRHLAFHPSGRYAYVNLETTSRVAAYRVDAASGGMEGFQVVSSLPPGTLAETNSTAEIMVHPDGRFLYVSNRGHDSIAVFAIDAQDGSLRWIDATSSGGRMPRSFAIDPGGRFLVAAHLDSGKVSVFRIDPQRGTLTPAGHEVAIDRAAYVRLLPR